MKLTQFENGNGMKSYVALLGLMAILFSLLMVAHYPMLLVGTLVLFTVVGLAMNPAVVKDALRDIAEKARKT